MKIGKDAERVFCVLDWGDNYVTVLLTNLVKLVHGNKVAVTDISFNRT